ncbi:MAG TPA: DUF4347 domain-containing protein [Trichocoleus sp.]|jgi:Ca2+-binding RTX toxin-like protein
MKTLVIADPSVCSYQHLVNSVSTDIEIVVLEPEQDGIEQITQALADRRSVQSLHILSHGAPGTLQLGSTQLSNASLDRYRHQLQQWVHGLTERAEVLLYGCEVAAGELGRQFVQQLSRLTQTSIAASTHLVGNADKGGRWVLDYQTAEIQSSLAFSTAAMAAYEGVLEIINFVTESFTGTSVLGTWLYGVGDPTAATQADPFLTASPIVTPPLGGIPGIATPLDTPGLGTLRLTNATNNQAAFVLYNTPVRSDAGLRITFDMFQYGGATSDPNIPPGADGINFFLLNGATPISTTPVAGAFGGSLGYAQKNTPTVVPGIAGGYLGIGFDAFGNYARATEGRVGGVAGGGQLPDAVTVRGSEATQYGFLTSTGTLPFSLDVPGAAGTRANSLRRVQVDLDPTGLLSVAMDLNNNNVFTDAGESLISNFNIRSGATGIDNGIIPDTFKFGFTAGTGASTNIHEIRNLTVQSFTSPPETTDALVSLQAGTAVNVAGLSGTDSDGTVQSFRILTLPQATQGTLYLGNPSNGGTLITVGQTLTPDQISQVFFQSTGGFTGDSFTYTAVDNLGAEDLTPGVVTLGLQGGGGVNPNNRLPETNNALVSLPQNSVVTVPGLSGTDLDGSIASYTIVTVPLSSQGTLYVGDPDVNGAPVQAGQILTPAQIGQLYFESTAEFQGGSFTYAATDDQGATDLTPAIVTLNLSNAVAPVRLGCKPGKDLKGNPRNNKLTGGVDGDTLVGKSGNDLLRGRACNDTLIGNRGNDTLMGGAARDTLRGAQNRDRLMGNNGRDTLDGGLGNDFVSGGRGDDLGFGRRGVDRIQGKSGNDELRGGRNNDRLAGGANADLLHGQQNNDVINGGNGTDTIYGGLGRDRVIGGKKADIAFGGRGADNVRGNGGADLLQGKRGNDILVGGSQIDRVIGGLGRDTITGGGGADVLSGNGGRDRFVYRSVKHGNDQILDFQRQDRIDLRGILNREGYASSNRFQKYVRLIETGGKTIVRVDGNGDANGGLATVCTLSGATPIAANFILS